MGATLEGSWFAVGVRPGSGEEPQLVAVCSPRHRTTAASARRSSGSEEFRWHFGPMFYRGRLGDHQVKVLVVGQEGAQDESLSHRSFTGGTGGRMQHLLNHLGINRSYLFLNTFVYPIFGQYNGLLPSSPSIRPRRSPSTAEQLFDYVVDRERTAAGDRRRTSREGVVGQLGRGPRWHRRSRQPAPRRRLGDLAQPAHGRRAAPRRRRQGRRSHGDHRQLQRGDQPRAPMDRRHTRHGCRSTPARPGRRAAYKYSSDPIPFADFPYGMPWRLGRGATSSNRRDGQTAIQLFSDHGAYNNQGTTVTYTGSTAGTNDGLLRRPGRRRLGAAAARSRRLRSWPGCRRSLTLLQGGKPGFAWPDFNSFGLKCSSSMGMGPIYRGRLDSPSLLVVADQQATDDLFTMRAATGDDGQHLQAFLARRRCHDEVRDLAGAAGRHVGRRPDRPRPRQSTARRSERSTPRQSGSPSRR